MTDTLPVTTALIAEPPETISPPTAYKMLQFVKLVATTDMRVA
jgi:hypothetical protein